MSRFLYFVEGLSGSPPRADVLRAEPGLRHAFPAGAPFASAQCLCGPGKKAGVVCAHGDGFGLKFDAETHIWKQPDGCKWWLGVPENIEERPGPDDLLRENCSIDFHHVTLGDERKWMVPVVRYLNGNTCLPCVMTIEDGHCKFRVREEWLALFDLAGEVQDSCVRGTPGEVRDKLLVFGAEVLRINYRVSIHEVSALELLDTNNVRAIADAALDLPGIRAFCEDLKKKTSALTAG